MPFIDKPPAFIHGFRRAIEAHRPQKFLRDRWNRLRFGADAPLTDMAIFPAPAEVTHRLTGRNIATRLRRQASGCVIGSTWDRDRVFIDEDKKLRSCRMRWLDGADWEETPQYQLMVQKVTAGERPDGCRSIADVKARYALLDLIFAEAKARGRLLRMHELPEYQYRREHGATLIHVGHDGVCLRSGGGAHRFAIAKVLDLPEVPSQIGVIHPKAIRDGHLERLRLSRFDV